MTTADEASRRRNGRVVAVLVFAAVALAASFGVMAQRAVTLGVGAWPNPSVQRFMLAHRTDSVTAVMRALTWGGSSTVLLLLIAVVGGALLARRRDVRPLLWLAAGLGGANLLFRLAKVMVAQPRPSGALHLASASGFGFPSGHAAAAIASWGMLVVVLASGRRRRDLVAFATCSALVVLLVGTSRIYLGVHWWTDVAAGLALGGSWLCILCAGYVAFPSASGRAGLNLRLGPERAARSPGAGGGPPERRSPPSPPVPPGLRRSSGR